MDFSFVVTNSALRATLVQLTRVVKPKDADEAILSCEDQALLIDFPGGQVRCPGSGVWRGQVRMSLRSLLQYSKVFPNLDPIEISAEGNRVCLGRTTLPCVIAPVAVKYPTLPLDPPLWAVLGLRVQHSEETLVASGLATKVQEAESQRDVLIERAAKTLAPLGVQLEDVQQLVQVAVTRRSRA